MAVSNTADLFFNLWNTFLWLGIAIGAIVFAVMGYLLLKYRAKESAQDPEDVPTLGRIPEHRGHARTVLISVTLSTIILGVLIFGTFAVIDQISTIPPQCLAPGGYSVPNGPCMLVNVVGYQSGFHWEFYYNNETIRQNAGHPNLVVPVGKIVVLNVTSADVVHNLTLIEFKIKTDAIPGRANVIWFTANDLGTYRAQCFELCGSGHYTMHTKVIVKTPADFQTWYTQNRGTNGA